VRLRSNFFLTVLWWVLALIVGVALWQLVWLATGGAGFSTAWETLIELKSLAGTGIFWTSVRDTIFLAWAGLLGGLILALAVGVGIGSSPRVDHATRGTLHFLRALPSVILLPLFMSSLGSFYAMVIYLVASVVAFKLVVFVIRGVRDADVELMDSTRILKLHRLEKAIFLLLPSAAVMVATGLRLSWSRAYGAVVLAGVIAGTPGIGSQIGIAQLSAEPAPILAYALIAGLMGVFFFSLVSAIERSVVRWTVSR